ncbi:MAG TPA: Ig-like domain-containing protein [Terriglobales bacterium]|nr:Ig-like domain-containing protein [Terriglobales bacterium]
MTIAQKNFRTKHLFVFLALLCCACGLLAQGPVILTADGQTDTYTLINNKLGAGPETPDCSHPAFGPHVTQAFDNGLARNVFVFHIHVTPDNDRCIAFDRQRVEIKSDGASPAYVKAFLGDTVNYTWKFKLDAAFQPSTSFTHIHQIKAGDGDSAAPIMTITPRKGSPNLLQIIHIDSTGVTTVVTNTPLSPFLGVWVEASEKITFGSNGSYSLTLKRVSDGAALLTYSNNNIDLWRTGTTFCRPKWGIYRSLNNPQDLRDEDVLFGNYCLAKGADDCSTDFTIAAAPGTQTVTAGNNATYTVTVNPINIFAGNVGLSVSGLPPGASATFNPSAINIGSGSSTLTISNLTAVGSYPLSIKGTYASLSHSSPVTLVVNPTATTTAISSNHNPSVFGQAVTLTATVSPAGATGNVQFKDGSNNLGAPSTLGNGTATFITPSLSVGAYDVTAVYSGDANFQGSTSPSLSQTVNPAGTSTALALTAGSNPSALGQSLTFTATVSEQFGGAPSGTVTFKDGNTTLGTGTLNSNTATLSTSSLPVGTHSIVAIYGGDGNFASSTSPSLAEVVTSAGTGTSTSTQLSAPAQIYFHQKTPVVLTVTVTASSTPTGDVILLEGSTQLSSQVPLVNGSATIPPLQTGLLHPGMHVVKAVYLGNGSFDGSESTPQTVNVSPQPKPR